MLNVSVDTHAEQRIDRIKNGTTNGYMYIFSLLSMIN